VSPSTRHAPDTAAGCRLINPEELEPGLTAWCVDPREPQQVADPQRYADKIVLIEEDYLKVINIKGEKALHVVYRFLRPVAWARNKLLGKTKVEVFTGLIDRKPDDNRLHFWVPTEGRL
jgi:hypothetical protein